MKDMSEVLPAFILAMTYEDATCFAKGNKLSKAPSEIIIIAIFSLQEHRFRLIWRLYNDKALQTRTVAEPTVKHILSRIEVCPPISFLRKAHGDSSNAA